jgi:uncharacterized protein YbjT (DUF2867 family)
MSKGRAATASARPPRNTVRCRPPEWRAAGSARCISSAPGGMSRVTTACTFPIPAPCVCGTGAQAGVLYSAAMRPILVIGASGNIGRCVVSALKGEGVAVRALSRDPAEAGLPPGVEVVRGDLAVPETLDAALDGIDSVFLAWTAPQSAVDGALERIVKRARRVVFLSSPHKTKHPFFQQPNPVRLLHAQIEQIIQSSGVPWTFLRPGMLASNALFWWAPQIRAGDLVRWPYTGVPTAPIDERDIATVAVRALCEDGHAGAEYVLRGPQSLTQAEQVGIIGSALGRSLQVVEMTPDEARRELLAIMPAYIIEMLLSAWAARAGQDAFVTTTVFEVTGTPARALRSGPPITRRSSGHEGEPHLTCEYPSPVRSRRAGARQRRPGGPRYWCADAAGTSCRNPKGRPEADEEMCQPSSPNAVAGFADRLEFGLVAQQSTGRAEVPLPQALRIDVV